MPSSVVGWASPGSNDGPEWDIGLVYLGLAKEWRASRTGRPELPIEVVGDVASALQGKQLGVHPLLYSRCGILGHGTVRP